MISLTTFAQTTDFPYQQIDTTQPTTALAQDLETVIQEDESLWDRLVSLLWFGEDNQTIRWNDNTATNYVTYVINIALGTAAFIALVMLLYGFGMMFFSEEEEGVNRAKNIIKGTVIALAIMGLARFIVSMIIFFFDTVNDVSAT